MECKGTKLQFHAWLDGELDPVHAHDVEMHLKNCRTCFGEAESLGALSQVIKRQAKRHPLPPELYAKIASLTSSPDAKPSNAWLPLKGGSMGATLSLAACLALFLIVRPDDNVLIQQEVLTSHIRSLQENHLMDVVSTDQHTVKPWFNGRLDFSPPVVDLTADGFPLVGGRLDYIDGHPVAVLVYKHNAHVINLFVWHARHPVLFTIDQSARQGYALREWQKDDLQFWAVSDIQATTMDHFTSLLKGRPK